MIGHLVHLPLSRGMVIYHRIRDEPRIDQLETYTGDILDERALSDRLRADYKDSRQVKIKGRPVVYWEGQCPRR